MVVASFPPVEHANEYGLLAVGGDLDVDTLVLAYSSGIFPWPIRGETVIPWFSPKERALLFVDDIRVNRSIRRAAQKHHYHFAIDRDFPGVLAGCQQYWSKVHGETWITDEMFEAYLRLYEAGYAHSVECYEGEKLVGGLYGVSIGGMFAGESMFHLRDDASKLALIYLAGVIQQRGGKWIDCQVMSPFFEQLGARNVDRSNFSTLLSDALAGPPLFSNNSLPVPG